MQACSLSAQLSVCWLRTLGASLVLTYLHVNLFVNYLSASRILTLFIYVLCCEMPFWQHHLISLRSFPANSNTRKGLLLLLFDRTKRKIPIPSPHSTEKVFTTH